MPYDLRCGHQKSPKQTLPGRLLPLLTIVSGPIILNKSR